jgi:GntR family transcriptional regulator
VGQPLYEGLAAEIRERISSGMLAPDERLPSESELATQHRMSRNAVRAALTLLAREGLLISRQGRGWFVRERVRLKWHISRPENNTRTDVTPADAWAQDVREQGRTPAQRIGLELMVADPEISERLQLTPGAQVWVRRRQRFVDGEFVMTSDSFYSKDLVDGTPIAEPGDVAPGVYAIMDELGVGYVTLRDEIFIRSGTAAEAERFGLQPGDAVAQVFRTRCTAEGRPVSVTVTTTPGDQVVIIIDGAAQ